MPNRNYEAGRRFEYKRMNYWKDQHHEVMRTAGSHGSFDVITISKAGDVQFIQCKVTDYQSDADRLIRQFKASPPLGNRIRGNYKQVMEIYVRETRNVSTGWV